MNTALPALAAALLASTAAAQPVRYELLPGGTFEDQRCMDPSCTCVPTSTKVDLVGWFDLTFLGSDPEIDNYYLENIFLSADMPTGRLLITGDGRYLAGTGANQTHRLVIRGYVGGQFFWIDSGTVPYTGPGMPQIHITAPSDLIDCRRVILDLGAAPEGSACYPDCDQNGTLDFFDFLCFQNAFLANDPYADCDGNFILDFFDFLCFQNEFLAGCP